jgi:hypothetical protein
VISQPRVGESWASVRLEIGTRLRPLRPLAQLALKTWTVGRTRWPSGASKQGSFQIGLPLDESDREASDAFGDSQLSGSRTLRNYRCHFKSYQARGDPR